MENDGEDGDDIADDIGDGHAEPDCEGLVVEEIRHQPDDGHHDDALAEHGERHGHPGAPDGLEIGRRGDVDRDAPDHAVGELQVVCGEGDDRGLPRLDEHARDPGRKRRDDLDDEGGEREDGRGPEA